MAEVRYSTGFELDFVMERGRANLLRCPVYFEGALVEPVDGSVVVLAPDGTTAFSDNATIQLDKIADVSVPVLTAYEYGTGWSVEFALLMPDGVTHTFRNPAALVRAAWVPDVSDRDLYRRVSALNPSPSTPNIKSITSETTWQPKIDEAGTILQKLLLGEDRRPWYIIESNKLRESHVLLALALIFEDIATRKPEYLETAASYRTQFRAAYSTVRFREDPGQTGNGSGAQRGPRGGTFFLGGRMP